MAHNTALGEGICSNWFVGCIKDAASMNGSTDLIIDYLPRFVPRMICSLLVPPLSMTAHCHSISITAGQFLGWLESETAGKHYVSNQCIRQLKYHLPGHNEATTRSCKP